MTTRTMILGCATWRRRRCGAAFLWLIVCLVLLSVSVAAAEKPPDSLLIEFKIEDQFKVKHTQESFRDSVVLIIGSDKGGKDYSRAWSTAVKDTFKVDSTFAPVKVVAVADMRGVPFFLKGFLRGKMPKEPENWMLLDWKGKFAKAYQYKKDQCNLLIFDYQGRLVYRTPVTEVDPARFSELLSRLTLELAQSKAFPTTE